MRTITLQITYSSRGGFPFKIDRDPTSWPLEGEADPDSVTKSGPSLGEDETEEGGVLRTKDTGVEGAAISIKCTSVDLDTKSAQKVSELISN